MEREYEFLPWKIPDRNTEEQLKLQAELKEKYGLETEENCYISPLWLAKKQTHYRCTEGKELAIQWINKIIENWIPDRGFAFVLSDHSNTSLMGTEMWLSILYLMCDYIGISHLLNYSPKGVHRLNTEI